MALLGISGKVDKMSLCANALENRLIQSARE